MRKTRELTNEGREFLQSEFSSMSLEFVPSAANFVLLRVGDGDKIFQALLRRGSSSVRCEVTNCRNGFAFPSERWIRTGALWRSCGAWIPKVCGAPRRRDGAT